MGIFKNLLGGCCGGAKDSVKNETSATSAEQASKSSCCQSQNKSADISTGHSPAAEPVSAAGSIREVVFSTQVKGMTCGNCVKHVTEALEGLSEVKSVEVALGGEQPSTVKAICAISISAEESLADIKDELESSLVEAISEAGYRVVSAEII